MLVDTIMAFEIVLAYETLVLVDCFQNKFGDKRPGGLIALGALASFISIIGMLLGTLRLAKMFLHAGHSLVMTSALAGLHFP